MRVDLIISALFSIPKSIYVNFKQLPFRLAIRLPLLIHYNTSLGDLNGIVQFSRKPTLFCVKYGFTSSYAMGG